MDAVSTGVTMSLPAGSHGQGFGNEARSESDSFDKRLRYKTLKNVSNGFFYPVFHKMFLLVASAQAFSKETEKKIHDK